MPPRNSSHPRSIRKVRVLDTQVTLPLFAGLRRSDSMIKSETAPHDEERSFMRRRSSSGGVMWLFNEAVSS
jgi:hypothetical protein